jgi:hypothetical protein
VSSRNPPTKKPERTPLIGQREIRGFLIGQRQTNQGESCIRAAGQIFMLFLLQLKLFIDIVVSTDRIAVRTNRLESGLKLFFVMQISAHSFWLDANFKDYIYSS